MSEGQRQCEATRKDGQPCRGWALTDSRYCFSHDPARARPRAEARRKGGFNRRKGQSLGNPEEVAERRYRTLAEIEALLEETINEARQLKDSVQKARTLGYLVGQWAKLYELGELQERMVALEDRMGIGRM